MALLNASNTYMTETYLHKWVKTAGDHFSLEFAWGSGLDPFRRMRIHCRKCNQTLTSDIPEGAEKIDWGLQKFVQTHRHDPIAEAKEKALVKETQDRLNAPKVVPAAGVTADFKPRALRHKEGRRFRETN
jgi:hypothetical protein